MKKLILGLLVFGLTTLGSSQQKKGKIEQVKLQEVKLQDVTVTSALEDATLININYSYLDKVLDKTTASPVKTLQSFASKYNVMDMTEFQNDQDSYEVLFTGSNGYIAAYYNKEGKILRTEERYRDVKIPSMIVRKVLSEFPESHFLTTVHTVNFSEEKDVRKVFKIRIKNDDFKKNLKFTSYGEKANSYAMTIEN